MKRLLLLSTVLAGTVLAASAPANATTYTLSDEYWLKAGTAFSTVFAGVSGSSTGGVYEETNTVTPTVVQLSTDTATSGYHLAPLPGEITQNDGGSALLLNGWSTTLFNHASASQQINTGISGAGTYGGTLTGAQSVANPGLNGTNLNFQYLTGATVNATTGVMTGTTSLFDLTSLQINNNATAVGFIIEGLRKGVVVDSQSVSYNFINGFVTFAPSGWTDIDTVAITDFNGSGSSMAIRNINISPDVAAVPEPTTLAILGLGLTSLGIARRQRRNHAA
jgi:hypothetical protein